ncbi:cation diffusion facilitator family transporter [Yersinia massiliensis]|jgi:cation diffusion facilitator family transporter|uniref:Cation diffusion facilitator family transporter n=2 Tax=Yersinia TaxID=629 RepID=A0A2R4NN22_9GAMM|nr:MULTISPECIES: cation diffusion facilitator family transporter [Yersinia]HEC1651930.1 cation diffusion facilitator family transporter [Yersinia enterocolitica]ATM86536.1 cation efflux family transporter [Yersinia frederiksenii]AVX37529.1 cation efflux family transporter [Yersinia massiliensis]MCB5318456.1 cation diffusion facilitator family transporter [Yersinia massiliensis]MDA5546417.1 cation diffusion facilitator family transporter [Yersinia massiliensis]
MTTQSAAAPLMLHDTKLEQQILRRSIFFTLFIATMGIVFGIVCGSMSIIFDGMFSALDAGMCSLSLLVSRLLGQPNSRRFQYGFWHVEPLVLAFNGSLLAFLCLYAFVNAIKGIIDGGRELELGWAIVYALVVSIFCFTVFLKQRRLNKRVKSELIALDTKSWLMSACISSALLVAFLLSWSMEGTRYEHLIVYTDPSVLALLTLILIPVPIKTVISAVREVLQMTPDTLDTSMENLMDRLMEKYQFVDYSHYATRIGRGLFVEIHVVIPPEMENSGVLYFDKIRDEISHAIGDSGPHRWLTISFTRDAKWL